jgi:hypothetical protein
MFWTQNGYKLNLKKPLTFCEKLQWLKLYDRRSFYHRMVDKIEAKKIVAQIIGYQAVIPTLAVWENIDDIDIADLPSCFVLKTTTGGGNNGVVICRDKSTFDLSAAKEKLKQASKVDIYKTLKEWVYKDIKPRFFAEQFVVNEGQEDLIDYKLFCFGGEPKYIQVIKNRRIKETIDFFDLNWQHQSFIGLNPLAVQSEDVIARPQNLDIMISYARKLSENIPFLRVDFYNIDGRVLFGETTFYPASGFGRFNPSEWDVRLGNLLKIPVK